MNHTKRKLSFYGTFNFENRQVNIFQNCRLKHSIAHREEDPEDSVPHGHITSLVSILIVHLKIFLVI